MITQDQKRAINRLDRSRGPDMLRLIREIVATLNECDEELHDGRKALSGADFVQEVSMLMERYEIPLIGDTP